MFRAGVNLSKIWTIHEAVVWKLLKVWVGRVWPHLRTVFIIFHVTGVFVYAMPSVSTIGKKKVWESERSQRAFAKWTGRINRVGLSLEDDTLQKVLWSIAQGYLTARKHALKPYKKYVKKFGLHQGWRMFANPKTHPSILIIEIEEDGVFRKVFETRSKEFNWQKDRFDHHAFRKFCGRIPRKSHSRLYNQLIKWLTLRAQESFPHATRLKVYLKHWRSPSATKRKNKNYDKGETTAERVVSLKENEK